MSTKKKAADANTQIMYDDVTLATICLAPAISFYSLIKNAHSIKLMYYMPCSGKA